MRDAIRQFRPTRMQPIPGNTVTPIQLQRRREESGSIQTVIKALQHAGPDNSIEAISEYFASLPNATICEPSLTDLSNELGRKAHYASRPDQ